jgi:hypothetical protein
LAVAVEGAGAQAGILVALQAKRMTGTDGLRRKRPEHRKAAGSQTRDDDITHEDLHGRFFRHDCLSFETTLSFETIFVRLRFPFA